MVRDCLLAWKFGQQKFKYECTYTFEIHFALNLVAKMSLERISGSEQKFICQYADLKMR